MRPIETLCDNCTLYDNGCKLNRLELFLKNNQAHKTPQGSYIVDRVCNTFVNKHEFTEPIHSDAVAIRKMVKTKFELLVFINSKTDVSYILDEIEKLNYWPEHVSLISKERINAIGVLQYAKTKKFKVDLQYIFDDKSIDMVVSKSTFDYICYCDNIDLIPRDYFHNIDVELNDKMAKFIMIKPWDDINGFVVYKKAFQAYLGNQGETIINKLETAALEQGQEGMIRDYVEFSHNSSNSSL